MDRPSDEKYKQIWQQPSVYPTIFNTKSEDRQISFCYNIGMWSFVGIISISDDSVELDDEQTFDS